MNAGGEPKRVSGGGDDGSPYERMGGAPAFRQLVHAFYERVSDDGTLRALYPEEDLAAAEDRLRMFLEQYWGGPTTYHEQRGHPRLRLRHAPFAVTPQQRDRWLAHMHAAIDTLNLEHEDEEALRGYVTRAAHFLVNADEEWSDAV